MKALLRILAAAFIGAATAQASDHLIIHEWGTLTCLEDENGKAIPGINSDDEPVPDFVHRASGSIIQSSGFGYGKSVPCVHPDVSVRLETPVLYVHAPAGFTGPLDVSVKFIGGWLTEYYPNADAVAPGLHASDGPLRKISRFIDKTLSEDSPPPGNFGHITPATVGSLHWAGLQVGGTAAGPETDWPVWLAPRKVQADAITTPGGESERYLFYRGVGCCTPILGLSSDPKSGTLRVSQWAGPGAAPSYWLADIRPDGSVAFQRVEPGVSSRPFSANDYSAANLNHLRSGIEADLIQAGLYKDEAEALLNTWEAAYFKNPGLRAFYLWPREQVDRILPLTITPAADVTRVMVGRIEFVTPKDREVMAALARSNAASNDVRVALQTLGRFANPLLLDEENRHPSPGLENFLHQTRVAYYQPY